MEVSMSEKARGISATILSALLFGVTPMIASMTYSMGSNAYTVSFYRNLLAVPMLAVIMLVRKISFRVSAKELGFLALIGILFRASTTMMLYASYDSIGIGTATTLHFLYPLCTVLLGWILFRDKMTPQKILALCLATGGILLSGLNGSAFAITGVALATASALTYASYMLGLEKSCLSSMNVYKTAFYMGIFNAAAIALFDLPTRNIVYRLPPLTMLLTAIVALCTSCLAVALLQKGICTLGAGNAAIFSMFEPLTSVLTGWLILHEDMSWQKAGSCLLVLSAVAIMILADRKKGSSPAEKAAASNTDAKHP